MWNNELLINETTAAVDRIKINIDKSCVVAISWVTNEEVNLHVTRNKPLLMHAYYNKIIYYYNEKEEPK